jgi:hypothetical protein
MAVAYLTILFMHLLGVTSDFYENLSQSNWYAIPDSNLLPLEHRYFTCYHYNNTLFSCMINYLIICDLVCRDKNMYQEWMLLQAEVIRALVGENEDLRLEDEYNIYETFNLLQTNYYRKLSLIKGTCFREDENARDKEIN